MTSCVIVIQQHSQCPSRGKIFFPGIRRKIPRVPPAVETRKKIDKKEQKTSLFILLYKIKSVTLHVEFQDKT